jgi:hypothetical protein
MQNELGPCAQFSVYHLMELKEGEERLKLNNSSYGMFAQEIAIFGAHTSARWSVLPSSFAGAEMSTKSVEVRKSVLQSERKSRVDPKTLGDISKLLRSKNAGPFEITLDVMFDLETEYRLVKGSELLNTASMAKLFGIAEDDIVWDGFFDQALAYKVTVPRLRNGKPAASGGYMENDVHASQQYIGFMNLALPEGFIKDWNTLQEEQKLISVNS